MVKKWRQTWYTRIMSWHKWFLPHRDTHQKAHLISWRGLALYIMLFIILQSTFSWVSFAKPGVLGTSSSITREQIIELTNAERAKNGLSPLSENSNLDSAAVGKAANMFSENYWAHFAPSGKSPWDFILGSGYKFSVAGENLAKNFSNSDDVVTAWMASPSHRENIVNSKYKDIGIAVEDGQINGQKTTLVVQMFGSTSALAFAPPKSVEQKKELAQALSPTVVPKEEYVKKSGVALVAPAVIQAQSTQQPLFDPFQVYKVFGVGVIIFIISLLALDYLILRKRGVFRITSHHLAHMAILGVAAATIVSRNPGQVSTGINFQGPPEVVYENSR